MVGDHWCKKKGLKKMMPTYGIVKDIEVDSDVSKTYNIYSM